MSNVFACNFPIPSSTNIFATIWKLTRTMKAAGWVYKASGAGASTGPKDYSGYNYTTTNSGSVSLSGLTTLTVASTTGFPTSGNIIVLTTGNGYQILSYTNTTSTTFTGITGGTGNIVNGQPVYGNQTNDIWGGSSSSTNDVYTNTSTTMNSGSTTLSSLGTTITVTSTTGFPSQGIVYILTTTNGWQVVTYTGTTATTLTGCSGGTGSVVNGQPVACGINTTASTGTVSFTGLTTILVASTYGFPSSGTLYILNTSNAWQTITYTGISGNSFTGCSGGSGNIASGQPVATPAIGLDNVIAWIVMQGPQSQKIPISSAPTGTPLRGEIITQATSSAEGELLGYVWDTISSSGWMAVLPHTGAFNNSNTITGSSSGATFSPTGTISTYTRELMLCKDTTAYNTAVYYGCFDTIVEANQPFSYLATQSACTATVAPGQGGSTSNNPFPARGIIVRGTANSTTIPNFTCSASNFGQNAQIVATNNTPGTGISPDGSFYLAISNTGGTNAIGTYHLFAFFRVDDSEPGDCDPFIVLTPYGNVSFNNITSTSAQTESSLSGGYNNIQFQNLLIYNTTTGSSNITGPLFFGYQSRGNGYLDTFNAYSASLISNYANSGTWTQNLCIFAAGLSAPIRIINSPATNRPLVAEPFALFSYGCLSVPNSKPQYKGRLRWLFASTIGNTFETLQNKTLLTLSTASTGTYYGPAIQIGPFDGISVPTF